jgi:hypothetical protein
MNISEIAKQIRADLQDYLKTERLLLEKIDECVKPAASLPPAPAPSSHLRSESAGVTLPTVLGPSTT